MRTRISSSKGEAAPQRRPFSGSSPLFDRSIEPRIADSIVKAEEHLDTLQQPDGYWEARVYDNVTMTAEYVMTLRFLGLLDDELKVKARQTILDCQLENGGWNIYGGGPADHSSTVEAYFALKLCGLTTRHRALKAARERIVENGGIATARVFTKIQLALFGEYPWDLIPVINPELMLLPKKAPINIYELSSWSRSVVIPLLIIFDRKPVCVLEKNETISELVVPTTKKSAQERINRILKERRVNFGEIFEMARSTRDQIRQILRTRKVDLEQIFQVTQLALSTYERIPMKPLRSRALKLAEDWILEHQDPKGNWGGIFPAMANSLMALKLRGYPLTHPAMQNGLQALRSFAEENDEAFRMQSTVSPVWDTAIIAYAMTEAARTPENPMIRRAIDYLLKEQILHVNGDWKFKAKKCRPGGWPFEHENDRYPDIDDSAYAILALLPHENDPKLSKRIEPAIDRGIEWLLGMQGSDGGWGAFDRDNNRHVLNEIPFADLKSLIDPSTPDVTGHVIEALGATGMKRSAAPIEKAVAFLRKTQKEDGSWFGRWGVAYIYGTGAVLSGLKVAGEKMDHRYIERAVRWLEEIQNDDGGWGESCAAYDKKEYVPLGNSTASQTAWALLGLLACPSASDEAIERAITYLLRTQLSDGSWEEPEWTGTGFPRHFYLRYDYYRLYWPLLALGRYARRLGEPRPAAEIRPPVSA
ncbi:MAG: squalene--hopene cyclase [Pseudomonadota bacterium]